MIAELRYKDGSKKELKISTLASRLKEVKGDVKIRVEIVREVLHNGIDACANDIDIDKLENDLHFEASNFTINSNEVKFNIFTGETIFFSSLVSIYEYIEHYVSFLCEKLDRLISESFKLEFDFYMSFMED